MSVRMETTCPYCGKVHDAQTGVNATNAVPQVGDFTICMECGQLAEFAKSGLIELTSSGFDELPIDAVRYAHEIRKRFLAKRSAE